MHRPTRRKSGWSGTAGDLGRQPEVEGNCIFRTAVARKQASKTTMTDNTFTPGPTPTSVLSNGKVLTPPENWALLPPGDAALTRRVKAAGDHWVVQEKKGRKIFSRGVWAPAATIERIRATLDAERSTEGYTQTQRS